MNKLLIFLLTLLVRQKTFHFTFIGITEKYGFPVTFQLNADTFEEAISIAKSLTNDEYREFKITGARGRK